LFRSHVPGQPGHLDGVGQHHGLHRHPGRRDRAAGPLPPGRAGEPLAGHPPPAARAGAGAPDGTSVTSDRHGGGETMSVLELDQVSRAFGGIQAVDGVSLTVAPGEIVGIIGPNGSGKSTLFNLITGVYRPDTGRILFQSQDITGWRPYRIARLGVGRTFQIPTLFQHLTAYETLLAAAVEGDSRGAPRRAAERPHPPTPDPA